MADLQTRFRRSLGRVTAPDLRPDIERRVPGAEQDHDQGIDGSSSRDASRRLAAAVTAFTVFAAAGIFAWRAFEGPDGATSAGAPPSPPGWLVARARDMAKNNDDPDPTSAWWVLTDEKTAAPAVGLTPDQVSGDPQYLVVLQGDFVALMASRPGGVDAPSGTTLVFTVDPATHQVMDWGVTNVAVDLPGLLPFELTAQIVVVPNVVGSSLDEARARLEAVGLTVGELQVVTGGYVNEAVVEQDPAPDTSVDADTAVDLVTGPSGQG